MIPVKETYFLASSWSEVTDIFLITSQLAEQNAPDVVHVVVVYFRD